MARSEYARVAIVGEEPEASPLCGSSVPFRMLVMGDFSGRASRGRCDPSLQGRRPILVNRNNFGQAMQALGVGLPCVRFAGLEEFEPDALYHRLPAFRATREANVAESAPCSAGGLEPLLRDAVAPLSGTDAAASRMRAILHHPEFQALESAWRALFFLVCRVEGETGLKLYILDAAKAELETLAEAGSVAGTPLYDIVMERSTGARDEPWAVLAGSYTFGNSAADLALVRALGRVARAAGAPFLGAASPAILGCASAADLPDPGAWRPDPETAARWQALRRAPEAEWVGLALPRFLLRLPYSRSAAGGRFGFEEMPGDPARDGYLWGNPVFACLELLARGFSYCGWNLHPDAFHYIEGLPAYLHLKNGEAALQPCAEAVLTEHAARAAAEQGLMAWLSTASGDCMRLLHFQSIADPATALPGRWQ